MVTETTDEDLEVTTEAAGLVLRARINRPEKRNALNEAVMVGLFDVLTRAHDSDARVVVIEAAGEETFSAGGDFTEMPIGGSVGDYRESFSALAELMREMHRTDALTVGAVQGECLAGGLGLAAACDLLVASSDATFATPEVRVGLFPVQAMVPIMRTVPEKRGLKLLFTGERIDAETAFEMGLVTAVYPAGDFENHLDDLVSSLTASSPVMISMGKAAYYRQRDLGYEQALDYTKEVIALMAMSDDTEEGIEAFLTDREPEWRGQ